jgi:hypothetical protein
VICKLDIGELGVICRLDLEKAYDLVEKMWL